MHVLDSQARCICHGVAELGLDVSRKFHPNRLKSYTVWNMKTNARPRNHGSRVDFILAASGQKPPGSGDSSRDTPDKVRPIYSSLRAPPGPCASRRRLCFALRDKRRQAEHGKRNKNAPQRPSC